VGHGHSRKKTDGQACGVRHTVRLLKKGNKMEGALNQVKNQRSVKSFSFNIIIISVAGFVLGFLGIVWYLLKLRSAYPEMSSLPLNGLVQFMNPGNYIIQSLFQIGISIVLIYSSYYVLKYSEKWRKILVYGLIASSLFLIIAPFFNTGNIPNLDLPTNEIWGGAKVKIVTWLFLTTYLTAGYFVLIALKLSREEIKKLFRRTT